MMVHDYLLVVSTLADVPNKRCRLIADVQSLAEIPQGQPPTKSTSGESGFRPLGQAGVLIVRFDSLQKVSDKVER